MRRLFTAQEAEAAGLTRAALRWGETRSRWRRLDRQVYGVGPEPPTALDRQRARVLASGAIACGSLAGVLHGLDGVALDGRPTRRGQERRQTVMAGGVRCADGWHTLVDLAAILDDARWEQALESALRLGLTTVGDLTDSLPDLGRTRTPGTARIRRVLALRPPGAPPTESLLETLMVQLAREVEGVPEPTRQFEVFDTNGQFVARVDLCWCDLGAFIELDGQHHKGQPVYDAHRETAVVAATGWLPGRFTWHEVVHLRRTTGRRLAALLDQARRRPFRHEPFGAPKWL